MIIVTGSAGMIGSGIVRHLNDQGKQELVLVDDLKRGEKWKNLVGKGFLDLIPKEELFSWLEGRGGEIEAIFHMGACSDTMESDADYLIENNYRYTIQLAEWALNRDVRFIYASSAATYGDGTLGFSDDEGRIEELRPLNMYAFSKQMVDLWMKREGVLDQVVALKYFNVFGPNEYHKGRMASMVLKMYEKARHEGVIQLYRSNDPKYPDGGQMRDFIYVKDAVQMTCLFLGEDFLDLGGIYNIGLGKATTWNELASALFAALERPRRIEYIDMPLELSRQYQNYTCADMRKFHKIFSEERGTPIAEAVKEYVQCYLLKQARW